MNAEHLAVVEAFARGLAQGLLTPSKGSKGSKRAELPRREVEQPSLWPRQIAEPDEVPLRESPEAYDIPPFSPDELRQIEEQLNRSPNEPPPGMYYRDVDVRDEIVNGQLG